VDEVPPAPTEPSLVPASRDDEESENAPPHPMSATFNDTKMICSSFRFHM
jgi:hypothetical protein